MRFLSRNTLTAIAIALALMLIEAPSVSAITIVTHYIGGSSPENAAGGGNLVDVFNTAARMWEEALQDPFTIDLYFGWESLGSAGTHTLLEQGGEPTRELVGTILFDNSGSVSFYMDPTPDLHEEYRRATAEFQDLGGGFINVARIFSYPVGDALERTDLLTVALHEIGHALGMSNGNLRFIEESTDGTILVAEDLPYAGSIIPFWINSSGVTSHFDLNQVFYGSVMSGVCGSERRIPSALDILANAQISGFRYLNLNLPHVPETTSSLFSRTDRVNSRPASQRGTP